MRRVVITDLVVIVWAVLGAQLIRFGPAAAEAELAARADTFLELKYTTLTVVLIVAWLLMLRIHGAFDRRVLGHGPEEYKAVAVASFRLFSIVAVASYSLHLDLARGYVAMALPAGMTFRSISGAY